MVYGDKSCLLKIHNVCLEENYICNHHVDVPNAIDEVNCRKLIKFLIN